MIPKTALLALAALPATQAFFLIPCWPLSTQRLDPLVFPGQVASHMHDIVGGSAFAPVLDYNTTQTSDCTSCMVNKDHSNYWMPSMYHNDGNTLTPVPQHGSASLYYLNEKTRLGPGEKMEALPVGLRVLAGFPDATSETPTTEHEAVNYKCLDYKGTATDHKGFPTKNCPDGVRAQVTFPSCWDGKNLDSDDHKSHMAYPSGGVEGGACPSTHPRHLVVVKMETIFKTFNFPWTGANQFVWSNGDTTGWGLHADMIMGWDYDVLSRAVEQCDNISGRIEDCPVFAGMIPAEKQWLDPGTCKVESYVNEDSVSNSPVDKLPGCNPLKSAGAPTVKMACNDGVTLKGNWADYAGKIGGGIASAASSAVGAIGSAVGGILPGAGSAPPAGNNWGQPAAPQPTAAPQQFYDKPAGNAAPAPAPPAAAPPAAAPPAGNPNVVTIWEWVTTTTTVVGDAPPTPAAAAAGGWNDAAKRDEHIHKHRHAHRRSNF